MAAADMTMPPPSPDVAQQQQPELARYADQARQSGAANPFANKNSGMDLAEAKMNQIAALLGEVAQVFQLEKPVLLEYLKKMSQVGSVLMQEVQQAKSQGQAPQAGVESAQGGQQPSPAGAQANVTA